MGFERAFSSTENKKLSDSDLTFLRDPANREFADSLGINKEYLFPEANQQIPIGGRRGYYIPKGTGISKKELSGITSQILGQQSKIQGEKMFGAPGSKGGVSDFQPIFGAAPPSQYSGQAGGNYGAMPEYKGTAGLPSAGGALTKLMHVVAGQRGAEFDQQMANYGANYFGNNPVINQGFNQPQLNQPQLNPQLLGQMGIGASSAPQNNMLSNLATRGMQQMSAGQTMNPTLGKATS